MGDNIENKVSDSLSEIERENLNLIVGDRFYLNGN